jgi:HEPN domain-containing protein
VNESLAWLRQSQSDSEAAEREYRTATRAEEGMWSHAVAKYQQTVEKAVKAIVAALREDGFWRGPPIGFVHEIERHIPFLVRLPRTENKKSVQRHLLRSLTPTLAPQSAP